MGSLLKFIYATFFLQTTQLENQLNMTCTSNHKNGTYILSNPNNTIEIQMLCSKLCKWRVHSWKTIVCGENYEAIFFVVHCPRTQALETTKNYVNLHLNKYIYLHIVIIISEIFVVSFSFLCVLLSEISHLYFCNCSHQCTPPYVNPSIVDIFCF